MRYLMLAILIMACSSPDIGAEPSEVSVRRGYLTSMPMSHPIVTDHDDYFDVYQNGAMVSQIIVVFAKDAAKPADRKRPLELRGRSERIDLGGPKGTRKSYSNDVLYVAGWKYIDKP